MLTAQQLHKAVLFELKRYDTTSMTPEEFNHHGPVGVLEYISLRYWAWDNHQKVLDDLLPIKVVTDGVAGSPAPLDNLGPDISGQEYFALPDDYLHLLAVGVKLKVYGDPCIVDGTLTENWTEATFLRDDTKHTADWNVYDKPSHEPNNLYYTMRSPNYILVRSGGSRAQQLCVTYLKQPTLPQLDVVTGQTITSLELGTKQQYEIAKWITHSYLETIESMRSQSMEMIRRKNFDQFPPVNQTT